MKLVIVTPVYNDWGSFRALAKDIGRVLQNRDIEYTFLVVNDDSSVVPPDTFQFPGSVKIIHLACNLGHQRAIAIGLSYLAEKMDFDAAIVMDADGEDKPEDIAALLDQGLASPDSIVVARRDKRSEGRTFRFGYYLYQTIFRVFTGQSLPFGNFCLLPAAAIKRLVYQESLWNHLPATILRSRFDIVMLSTERGKRYTGHSKMNAGSLVLLGLSAVAVYSDMALLRTLFASFGLSLLAVVGIAITTAVRLMTDLAIPGWASNVVGSMAIILVQCLVMSVFLLFIVLSNRSQRGFIVARHYQEYISQVEDK